MDLDALDSIEEIRADLSESDARDFHDQLVDDGYRLTGALIVGQYVAPDGRSSAMLPVALGNMNAWTQEGIHRWGLRRLATIEGAYQDEE